MAKRYIRNTVILVKPETTPGVDAVPTGAENAVLVSEMSITPLDAKNVDRNLVRGYFGASEQLVGVASVKVGITVELAGSGTAATPPAWGNILLACAMAEGQLSTPNRVEYTPVSDNLTTDTIYYYDSGVLHKLVGVMGNATLSAKAGERPVLKFEFVGLDAGIAVATNPSTTLTAWKKPVVMTKANVADITLGCSYAAGALSGGTQYNSNGIELALGNAVNFNALLGEESVDLTDRVITGSVEFDLSPAQEVAMMANVKTNVTQSLGMAIGTTSGNKIILFGAAAQLTNPKKVDMNGRRMIGYDLRLVPVSGNDELRIACV